MKRTTKILSLLLALLATPSSAQFGGCLPAFCSNTANCPPIGGVQFNGVNIGVIVCGLTVTGAGAITTEGARSLSFHSTGKYYVEYTQVTITNTGDTAFGMAQASATYAQMIGLSAVSGYAEITANVGDIWANGFQGTFPGPRPIIGAGHVGSMAVDLTNHLVWFTVDCSSNWNVVSGDPFAGTGGITIPNAAFAPAIAFNTGDLSTVTANFGASAFVCTPPTGFGNW